MATVTTTIPIAANADDQYVGFTGTTYPPSTTFIRDVGSNTTQPDWVYRGLVGATHEIDNTLLAFDTTQIPVNALILSATLRVYVLLKSDADTRSISIDYYNWDGTSQSDFTATAQTGAHAGTTIAGITTSQYNNFALLDPDNGITKGGTTKLRMHVSGGQPTGENYINIADFANTTNPEPQLVVTYATEPRLHAGNDIFVDETTTNTPVALNTAPAAGATNYALASRQLTLATGSVPCSFTTASGGIGGSTTEALATLTPVRDFATGTAATAFTVPAGKTMRITGFWGVARRDTTTGSITWELEMNLHVETAATATTSSPVVFSGVAAWKELAAAAVFWIGTAPVWFEIPGGIELPAGASFALGYRNSSSQPSRTTNAICVTGFEY